MIETDSDVIDKIQSLKNNYDCNDTVMALLDLAILAQLDKESFDRFFRLFEIKK